MIANKTQAIASMFSAEAVHPPNIGKAPGIEPMDVFSHVIFFNGV